MRAKRCGSMSLTRGRWIEFFEGENARLSMARLLCFLSFFPSSYVVVHNVDSMNIENILAYYIGGYVLGYVGGKTADVFMDKKRRNRDMDSDIEEEAELHVKRKARNHVD